MNDKKLTQIANSGLTKFNIAPKKEAALEQLKAIQKELANIGKEYKLNIISKLDNFRKIAKALQALRVQGVVVLTLEEIKMIGFYTKLARQNLFEEVLLREKVFEKALNSWEEAKSVFDLGVSFTENSKEAKVDSNHDIYLKMSDKKPGKLVDIISEIDQNIDFCEKLVSQSRFKEIQDTFAKAGYDEFAEDFKKDLRILKGQFVILKESLSGYNVHLEEYVEHTLKEMGDFANAAFDHYTNINTLKKMEEYGNFLDMEEKRIKDKEKESIDFFWGTFSKKFVWNVIPKDFAFAVFRKTVGGLTQARFHELSQEWMDNNPSWTYKFGNLKIVVGSKMNDVEPLEKELNIKVKRQKTVRGYLRLTK